MSSNTGAMSIPNIIVILLPDHIQAPPSSSLQYHVQAQAINITLWRLHPKQHIQEMVWPPQELCNATPAGFTSSGTSTYHCASALCTHHQFHAITATYMKAGMQHHCASGTWHQGKHSNTHSVGSSRNPQGPDEAQSKMPWNRNTALL